MNESLEPGAEAARAAHASSSPRLRTGKRLASIALASVLCVAALLPAPARAVDGCMVMLCLAAPSWSKVARCVPTVQQVLCDLAHGRPFPTCAMSGAGNTATSQWSNPPTYCPAQYTRETYLDTGTTYSCDFAGAVEVTVNGVLWTRT